MLNNTFGFKRDEIILTSAKTGVGIPELVDAVIERISYPVCPYDDNKLRCLIFDSYFDSYRGVVILARIISGSLNNKDKITREYAEGFIKIFNPICPHITEEIWEMCGFDGMLNAAKWPEFDESKCVDSTVEIVVQINGKIKAKTKRRTFVFKLEEFLKMQV